MRDPTSAVLADIYVSKMKEDIIAPVNPHFYKRYVDDTYIPKKKTRTG